MNGGSIVIKLKCIQIILPLKQEKWYLKTLNRLGLIKIVEYGGSELLVLELRVLSLN